MDWMGRRKTMFFGFLVQGIVGFILGGALGPIQSIFPLFVVLYGPSPSVRFPFPWMLRRAL